MIPETYYSAVIAHSYYSIFYGAKAYLAKKGVEVSAPEEHKKHLQNSKVCWKAESLMSNFSRYIKRHWFGRIFASSSRKRRKSEENSLIELCRKQTKNQQRKHRTRKDILQTHVCNSIIFVKILIFFCILPINVLQK